MPPVRPPRSGTKKRQDRNFVYMKGFPQKTIGPANYRSRAPIPFLQRRTIQRFSSRTALLSLFRSQSQNYDTQLELRSPTIELKLHGRLANFINTATAPSPR